MGIVAAVDDSFKRPGSVPFSWEPPKKLSPLRLKPLSHSQPLLPPAALSLRRLLSSPLAPSRSLSPLAPSFRTPSKLKPPPPSQSGLYSPAPSFRSTPRAFSERWQLNRSDRVRPGSESEPRPDFGFAGLGCFPTPKFRLRKSKTGGRRKNRVEVGPRCLRGLLLVGGRFLRDGTRRSRRSLPSGSRRDSPAKLNGSVLGYLSPFNEMGRDWLF
ncbi:hypothetical protein HID58_095270 [Brassica napus]|uniref:Uncharacterized protein n=1 Tax=Brassica napus TaxID=3708 RepID=A0ABQ7X4C8_BRANA|nr:hypothetical protein HID58_095270 [Brassica napus]